MRSAAPSSPVMLALALGLLLSGTLASQSAPDESLVGKRFLSPDGRRALYLKLIRNDSAPAKSGLAEILGRRSPAPTLAVEYSMVRGKTEAIVRPFVIAAAEKVEARYRVLWDDEDQRVLVLCDQPPQRSGDRGRPPIQWATGEYVVFFLDRLREVHPPSQQFVLADWTSARIRVASEATVLPVVSTERDFKKPAPREHAGKTGEMRTVTNRPGTRERIQNFTIHANTQNLGKWEPRPNFALPPTQLALPSPDRQLEARWLGDSPSIIVLAEGGAFRDQLWVLRYDLQLTWFDRATQQPLGHRFVWSKDARHLLLLSRASGQPGLSRWPSGEEVVFLFDTREWDGVLAPGEAELKDLDFGP